MAYIFYILWLPGEILLSLVIGNGHSIESDYLLSFYAWGSMIIDGLLWGWLTMKAVELVQSRRTEKSVDAQHRT